MKIKKIFKTYVVFLSAALFLVPACTGQRYAGQGSPMKLYETFFAGEEGTQYYIKPLKFKNTKNEKTELDFSFRYKDRVKDSVIVNMSFFSNELIRQIDSCVLSNNKVVVPINNLKHLFLEREGKKYNLRYSGKASLADIQKLFTDKSWSVQVHHQKKSVKFIGYKSTLKKIDKLNYHIFSLFNP